MDTFHLLGHIGTLCVLINSIIYVRSFAGNGKAFQYFSAFLLVIALIQVILTISTFFNLVENNLYMSNIYIYGQFILLSFFYKILLESRLVYVISMLVILFSIVQNVMDPTLFFRYNTIGIAMTQGVLVTYSLFYFYKALSSEVKDFHIINFGIFLYLTSSTLIFASGNFVFDFEVISKKDYLLLLKINAILFIVFQFIIFIEWWRNYRPKVSIN